MSDGSRSSVLDSHLASNGVQRALVTAPTTPGTVRRVLKAFVVPRAEEAPVLRHCFRIVEPFQLGRIGIREHGSPSLSEWCAGQSAAPPPQKLAVDPPESHFPALPF